MPVLDTARRTSTTSTRGITNRCRCFLLDAPDRPAWTWIALSLLVALVTACGFPRPPDIGDDATPAGCSRDQDCSSPTPFCVDTTCAACRDSTSCPLTRPVCDMVSHDCRTCVKDSECDSGACDLAAGRCVDQGAILYASSARFTTDPCTPFHMFDSNIFYNVPTISAAAACQYQYNLSVPNAGLAGTGNITGDPMFKDAANSDFHLKPGSAAIDAANPGDVFTGHDLDGTPRPKALALTSEHSSTFPLNRRAQHAETKSQQAMDRLKAYADLGGRVFLSHWHNIWIESSTTENNKNGSKQAGGQVHARVVVERWR